MRKLLNILHQYKQNYLVIRDFLKSKTKCKVIFFSIPTEDFFAFQTYDVFETVNKRVTEYSNGKNIRKALKLAWLTTLNKFDYPVQLIKSDEGYFCHPGTDRILVMTYLNPTKFVTGLYLWYPELDPQPVIFNYDYKELKTPLQILRKFKPSETLKFKSVQMNKDLDVSDKDPNISNATFFTAKKYFGKVDKSFDSLFMSWHDNMQWQHIKKYNDNDLIRFDDRGCKFGSTRLKLINGVWIKE